jgi:hypothetical protein
MTKGQDKLINEIKKQLETELFKLRMNIMEKSIEDGYDDFDHGYLRGLQAIEERIESVVRHFEIKIYET